jgi:hypothetical protein
VAAEVGRQRSPAAVRQQVPAEQHDDRHGSGQERDPHEGELEVAERADSGVHRRLVHDHVHGRSGERQHRPGVGREHEGHEQLRGRLTEPDRRDHDYREERGDRPVHADQRGDQRDQQHHQDEQPRPALAGLGDQELSRPRGHAGGLEASADYEERGDEDDGRIAEPGQGVAQIEDAREVERERRPERHEHHRDLVPDEQEDDRGDDREGDRDIIHRGTPPSYPVSESPRGGRDIPRDTTAAVGRPVDETPDAPAESRPDPHPHRRSAPGSGRGEAQREVDEEARAEAGRALRPPRLVGASVHGPRDIEMGPRHRAGELGQEQGRRDGAGVVAPDVLHVCDVGVELLPVALLERQPPHRLVRGPR